ncbi:hypothetical protein Rhal01_00238 [Rubritalea halochordaticola]|uniref:Uncharacterized protein n=1 Tax=Rubritalea halochordaticola TaxID=714537 RepID=A0ABP9UUQ7_9BACT
MLQLATSCKKSARSSAQTDRLLAIARGESDWGLIVFLNVPVGLLEEVMVGVQLVLQQ